MRLDCGDQANASVLRMDVHCGTHIDAPLHALADGLPVEQIPLETLLGPVLVADLAGAQSIGREELDGLAVAPSVTRLLFRTSNSDRWRHGPRFDPQYVGLTLEGGRWLAERGIGLVGLDYVSVQRFADEFETHRVLLSAGIVLLEGINLEHVAPGRYELLCLPLSLVGAEAAPARAILVRV